jgi:hypothetical protein
LSIWDREKTTVGRCKSNISDETRNQGGTVRSHVPKRRETDSFRSGEIGSDLLDPLSESSIPVRQIMMALFITRSMVQRVDEDIDRSFEVFHRVAGRSVARQKVMVASFLTHSASRTQILIRY